MTALPPRWMAVRAGLLRRIERRRIDDHPSFHRYILAERRLNALRLQHGLIREVGFEETKASRYALAERIGVEIPTQYGSWDDLHAIPWDDLPDQVVIKSDVGSTSHGVVPLVRAGARWRVVSHPATTTTEEVVERLARAAASDDVGGPFHAEELLTSGRAPDRLPDDIKIYAFYGEPVMVLLRRVAQHGRQHTVRIVDADRKDLMRTYRGEPLDTSIELPVAWDRLLDAAARLSLAVCLPFARVDLYAIDDRVVFGELTPRPGGNQRFAPAVDRELGRRWEEASVRLTDDLARGRGPVSSSVPGSV